jgi:DNA topoisomerase-1
MSSADVTTLYAGDATVVEDATDRAEYRGRVVVLAKPDGTVLVHDRGGYQPVAWLTRADAVTVTDDEDVVRITAHDERADDWLRVTGHATGRPAGTSAAADPDESVALSGQYPVSVAGDPVGDCPACDGALVDAGDAVACIHCDARHGYPGDATLPGATCDCGLPRMRVERGAAIDCCVDRDCEPLDDRVREHLDGEFGCPTCGTDLVVARERGLFLACDDRPACDTAFYVPSGIHDGTCDCGLPTFDVGNDHRCLDATCDRT